MMQSFGKRRYFLVTHNPGFFLLSAKLRKRFVLILANSANTLLLPVFNIAISLLVIRLSSDVLWGEFVAILIVMNLLIHILHWGNKEYLLRAFSQSPKTIANIWQNVLITRLVLFGCLCAGIFFSPFSPSRNMLLIGWGLAAMLAQSFDALALYHRRFFPALFLEFAAILFMVAGILFNQASLEIDFLITLFALAAAIKTIGFFLIFRKTAFPQFTGKFEGAFFSAALPFFLLGLSGMLQSRTDLYCVAWFLTEKELGRYQVFINMLIYIQVMASLILQPFLKNIYRLGADTIQKITWRLFSAGIGITLPALAAIYFLLNYIYRFEIGWAFLSWGALFVLPIYFYLPTIYFLYKVGEEKKVLWVNIFGIAANFVLNMLLIRRFGLSGAIMASALSQWLMLIIYQRLRHAATELS